MFRLTRIFILCLLGAYICLSAALPARATPADSRQPDETAQPLPDMDRMLGSMLMFGFRGASLAVDDAFLQMVAEGKIGNVILFDRDVTDNAPRNIVSPQQVKNLAAALRSAAPGPIFIAIDQEGGQVRRLKPQKGFFDLPSAQVMGQANAGKTFELADAMGAELAGLGINMDLAPVVDVDTNPFNPAIGRLGRAFSSDAAIVARHAQAFGAGLAKNHVAPVLKHFPGQGCAKEDSHLGDVDVSQCWNAEVDLLPYAEIFRQGWPGAVMTGHIRLTSLDDAHAATFSRKLITGLLRQGLGWQGVVISDDLQMKGAAQAGDLAQTIWRAIDAGVDILLFGNNIEWDAQLPRKVWQALRALVNEGKITPERVAQSWRRINALRDAIK